MVLREALALLQILQSQVLRSLGPCGTPQSRTPVPQTPYATIAAHTQRRSQDFTNDENLIDTDDQRDRKKSSAHDGSWIS